MRRGRAPRRRRFFTREARLRTRPRGALRLRHGEPFATCGCACPPAAAPAAKCRVAQTGLPCPARPGRPRRRRPRRTSARVSGGRVRRGARRARGGRARASSAGQPSRRARTRRSSRLKPQVLHAAGFGQFNGNVRHIAGGNKPIREDEEQTHGRAPDEPLHSATVSDGAYQGAGASAEPRRPARASPASTTRTGVPAGRPTPNGDVGPSYYVQTVNTSIGIFNKTGARRRGVHASTRSVGQCPTGTPCDNSNQGDPVVVYDTFGDRWIVADFAWNDAAVQRPGRSTSAWPSRRPAIPFPAAGTSTRWQIETGASCPTTRSSASGPTASTCPRTCSLDHRLGAFQNVAGLGVQPAADGGGNPNAQAVTFDRRRAARRRRRLQPASEQRAGRRPARRRGRAELLRVDLGLVRGPGLEVPRRLGDAATRRSPARRRRASRPSTSAPSDACRSRREQPRHAELPADDAEPVHEPRRPRVALVTHTGRDGGSPNVAAVALVPAAASPAGRSRPRRQAVDLRPRTRRTASCRSLAVDQNGDMALGYSVSSASTDPAIRYAGRLAGDRVEHARARARRR